MDTYQSKKTFSRNLRQNQTDAEAVLWWKLRNRQLDGAKFRRQQQIGNFIVDFVCFEKMIVIEVDGGQHGTDEGSAYDAKRTAYLNELGYNVLRFWDNEVLTNTEDVINTIHLTLTLSLKEREE